MGRCYVSCCPGPRLIDCMSWFHLKLACWNCKNWVIFVYRFPLKLPFSFFLMPWCNANNHDLFFHLFVINIYSQVGTLPSFWRFVHQSKFNVLRLHSYKHTNAYSHVKHHRKFRHWLEKQRKKKAETEQMQHTAQSNNLWADFTQTTFFRQ